jgi:hypothetical protein
MFPKRMQSLQRNGILQAHQVFLGLHCNARWITAGLSLAGDRQTHSGSLCLAVVVGFVKTTWPEKKMGQINVGARSGSTIRKPATMSLGTI